MSLLSEREKLILKEIVYHFIINAVPVSSSLISQKSNMGMSPATIRNVMVALEKKGYISQPHASAGRIPRTAAYRMYVDTMMKKSRLSSCEKEKIRDSIEANTSEGLVDELLREISRILAHLSKQLGIITSPRMELGIFERMDLIKFSSEKILVVITIKSGLVKTIMLGMNSSINGNTLQLINQILNERLYGMTIVDIRTYFIDVVKDIQHEESGLIKLFAQKANYLFDFKENSEVYFTGAHHIVQQQDFFDIHSISSVVEMLESNETILHLLNENDDLETSKVKIGEELQEQNMEQFSIITARYKIGNIDGILGIIGPNHMNYSRLVSLVEYTARTITAYHPVN